MDSITGEWPALLKMVAALVLVLGLMGGLALVLKQLGLSGHVANAGKKNRLKIVEAIPLDNRRRLALIQRDDIQHLVILGPNSETVVETNIAPDDNEKHDS